MSKSDYPYAPDEFDVPAPEGAPVGVFRAPRSGWSKTWPFLLVAGIFAVVGIGGVYAVSGGFGGGAPEAGAKPPAASVPAEDPAAGDPATEETPVEEEPVTEETPVEEPADPATDVDALLAAADKGAFVRVLNDKGPEGESRVGKAALDAKGFTKVEFAPYPGDSGVTVNSIWYAADRKETALAVAAVLGIPAEQVTQVDIREGDVLVVVKSALTVAP
ncbi:LytR C-terminal domain-containing protein [Oerskovia enterophila]|uniref:LytR C-terminal domain-containing protein n=1 Tax=Oerskovia enterophila TaxID=43678 RepID=UPI00382181EA